MSRLIQIDRDTAGMAAAGFEPMPPVPDGWKVARPRNPDGLPPWFELTPHGPFVDTRVRAGGIGIAATLETFGGTSGPGVPEPGIADHVILGGAVMAPGSPPPADVDEFRRQSGLRLCVSADDLPVNGECLLLFGVIGYDAPIIQIYLGRTEVAERPLVGEERLAIVLSGRGNLEVDLRLRLAGHAASSKLAVLGVQGFLL